MSGQRPPDDPDGYVALPGEARSIVTRCVVCGSENATRAVPPRATTVHPDDDGHVERLTPRAKPLQKALLWPDGALAGSCPSHDQGEVITALRLRGPAPYGFVVAEEISG